MTDTLLPNGFYDILAPESQMQADMLHQLMDSVANYGYDRVSPPFCEFDTTFFFGPGESLKNQSFRLTDPISHRTMVLRSDMTGQVGRMALSRLKESPLPLRLCYAGSVLRLHQEGLYQERHVTQAGLELIGVNTAEADAEPIIILCRALLSLGIPSLTLDINFPSLITDLYDALDIDQAQRAAIDQAMMLKDAGKIVSLLPKEHISLFEMIMDPACDLHQLMLQLPAECQASVARVLEVISLLNATIPQLNITHDLAERAKFLYHTGMTFSIFSTPTRQELGRGGRYVIDNKKQEVDHSQPARAQFSTSAVGGSIYMNDIIRALDAPAPKSSVLIPFALPQEDILLLQSEGYRTIIAQENGVSLLEQAKELGCDGCWDEGDVKNLS